ncbi:hypothetical protein QJS10_CPA05g01445 [Acorus calamus]|uniref:oligopeptidase A n=1 Tax=Acorus calamus TaxID=4465 RepID=A0AAV9EVV8_ACOCL|nr:hypothetical protein QJS10_CPA05g01445 [Acorus calamus]
MLVTASLIPLARSSVPRLPLSHPLRSHKSFPCPLWSSSFSFCLSHLSRSTSPSFFSCSSSSMAYLSSSSVLGGETLEGNNPLIQDFVFPPFDAVKPEHVRPGIRALLKKLVEPTWPRLVEPLERIVDGLQVVWGAVNHLKAVKDCPELRSAVEEVQPEKVKFQLRLGQSKLIYNAFKAMQESSSWEELNDAQKRIVEGQVKEAVLNGVSLEDDKREQFNKIEQELEKLSQKFDENVLDSIKQFEKLITDKNEIEGLPPSALSLAAQTAVSKGHVMATAENGPWMITLDVPSYLPVMQHARNRSLREEVYRAYCTRASSGDFDNTAIIDQILKLRLEKAKLLGYNNYAEVSMAMKMATVEKAKELLEKLRSASWKAAIQEMADLKVFAKEQGAVEADDLNHWDITFWSERLREAKYDINEEELRPFFSLPKVMDGLFSLAKTLFDINIEPADGLAPVWNSDVRFYCVKDSLGDPIAYFYFDPYSRPSEKRGGAWMDEVLSRSRVFARDGTNARLPVAHMVCNQTPPVGDKPSLMTFREVETVFHEFGHALQHMLTKQDEGLVAGIRGIEWDAIELPSQFMENWCYQRDTLMSIARHYETGEPLPEEVYLKLLAARTFNAGSLSLRQLRFASLDLELHSKYVPGGSESIYDVDQRAIRETGQKFRETILALGGGKAPLEVFINFRGREPSPEALLRHNGLLELAASA